ncbi:MAG: FAD-dependent oxidoreductase [Polyangiaceae bacterium]|nr:FAD-dependent oxidoreductase [Polyangiaceae bacterium]
MTTSSPTVLIIGGGATGTGLARDLALRGVPSIVVDQGAINAGASGANHGLLHSGARYVATDPDSAAHCFREGQLLRNLAPHCIEDTKGLFVAIQGDDDRYIADFPSMCEKCGIPVRNVDLAEARAIEPALTPNIICVYEVPDATIDPFTLSIENMNHACALGAALHTHTRVVEFAINNRRIVAAIVVDTRTGQKRSIAVDEVVNASGAWSGKVAALAGIPIDTVYSKGTLLVTQHRFASRVINRLRRPANADIIVPGGIVSVLGTTSTRVDSPDGVVPTIHEVDTIIEETSSMIPALTSARILRAFSGVRPLISQGTTGDDRAVSRDLSLFDHSIHGIDNFVTITGGKLTTYRQMAEKAADIVCNHLGVTANCQTATLPLPQSSIWTLPGVPPHEWRKASNPSDLFLCECELVPRTAVDQIAQRISKQGRIPQLQDIISESRVAKGACQGSFCSMRVLAYLRERGYGANSNPISQLKDMLCERWKGQRVTANGAQLRQFELEEAMLCGFLGLELEP